MVTSGGWFHICLWPLIQIGAHWHVTLLSTAVSLSPSHLRNQSCFVSPAPRPFTMPMLTLDASIVALGDEAALHAARKHCHHSSYVSLPLTVYSRSRLGTGGALDRLSFQSPSIPKRAADHSSWFVTSTHCACLSQSPTPVIPACSAQLSTHPRTHRPSAH
jgi:hypothetical protein